MPSRRERATPEIHDRLTLRPGMHPWQSHWIAFPRGRYQALSITWDSGPTATGSQRWLHLYPHVTIGYRDYLLGPTSCSSPFPFPAGEGKEGPGVLGRCVGMCTSPIANPLRWAGAYDRPNGLLSGRPMVKSAR
jgi:hypothetical protein